MNNMNIINIFENFHKNNLLLILSIMLAVVVFIMIKIFFLIHFKLKQKKIPLLIRDNFLNVLSYKIFSIKIIESITFEYPFLDQSQLLKHQVVEILFEKNKQFFLYTGRYELPEHILSQKVLQKNLLNPKKIKKLKRKHHLSFLKQKDMIESNITPLSNIQKNQWLLQNQIT